MKKLILDLDNTITDGAEGDYADVGPNIEVLGKIREYKKAGFEIVISTARNMRTHNGNVGKINVHTLPIILAWLEKHDVPFDEVHVGKPWCGHDGFYVDDRAIRPKEFVEMSYTEVLELIE